MKQIILATVALALSVGAAFAENPYVGMPEDQVAQDKAFRAPGKGPFFFGTKQGKVDYTAPASIHRQKPVYRDGSAHRFGDASPSSYKN